ncbi:hypothetical protein COT30_00810 [Candidatus Micrarchaeota archaeon CG08_land_8_20_14_0_20_49_17]|nr:MAG: hypothetical protein COT30_00810 [Candidatus Micrarchaeota archaeon CG08_land_8_20_14_0_20_49_17]PIU81166.1 MAG: hypothetical protein COS70_05505 [Candidatus Micrarchaeota archaeon CG06_land_8_20_14_3_00_50_6]PIZ95517.1 MAG: hypothetical protein COX84_04410 [Candidatus Micrarchaeota archaeon CG_4_10_14_0_2_um_filter_49_7]
MVRLNELFGGASRLTVMDFFLANPTKKTYAAELIGMLKLSRKSIFDSLKSLNGNGFLLSTNVGRTIIYTLNRENPIVRHMKIIKSIADTVPSVAGLKGIANVFLYGSAARGEDDEESDVDLLVIAIGESRAQILAKMIKTTEKLKPIIFTPLEYAQLAKKDKALYERLETDKIRLV